MPSSITSHSAATASWFEREPLPAPSRGRIVGWCGLVAVLGLGCSQKPFCGELGSCGGSPVGD
jgi:hypothetical protein